MHILQGQRLFCGSGPRSRGASQRSRPAVLPVAIQQYRGNAGQSPPPSQGSDQFISSQGPFSSSQSVDAQPRRATAASATGRQQWEPQGTPERQRYELEMVDARRQQGRPSNPGQPLFYATTIFAGATLAVAALRLAQRFNSPTEKHTRDVDKNKFLVDTLSQYLPDNRMGLDSRVVAKIQRQTGFQPEAVFRKYLWFLLRERKFDQGAVDDMVLLKSAFGLSADQVAGALHERASRIYQQYGNVMLEVKGMTKAGVERKATCRALFSKLLYLQECDELIPPDSPAQRKADIPGVFGATVDDTASLRIVSLQEVDFDSLEAQFRDLGIDPPPMV